MSQWFVLKDDVVEGPFSTEDVKELASRPDVDHIKVWGQPQKDWRPLSWWMVELPNLLAKSRPLRDDRLWHFATQGVAHGPMTREDLVKGLRQTPLSNDILVWTKGMKAWAPLFEFNDLMDEVGINRRQHPRADIDGYVTFKFELGEKRARLFTISSGGFGCEKVDGLRVGQIVSAELNCDAFYEPVHAKVEIRYGTESGYVGCKFTVLSSEAKSTIVQYVRGSANTMVRAA